MQAMGNFLSGAQECTGTGECLFQLGPNSYCQNNQFFCMNNCQPMPCRNFLVCDVLLPEYVLNKNEGICLSCDLAFGKWTGGHGALPQQQLDECPICYEENILGISNPRCNHFMCIECFKKCYARALAGEKPDPEPKFPYQGEVYDIYMADPHNELWGAYDDIVEWELAYNSWSNRQKNQLKTGRCPWCRI